MCDGFGAIVSKVGGIYFTHPDYAGDCSHSDILCGLGWPEQHDTFARGYVRVQCPDWTIGSFEFDEDFSLPGWAENNQAEIRATVENVLNKVAPLYFKYEKEADRTLRLAGESLAGMEKYNRTCKRAWSACKKIIRANGGARGLDEGEHTFFIGAVPHDPKTNREKEDAVCLEAEHAFQQARETAWKARMTSYRTLLDKENKIKFTAYNTMIQGMSTVFGYVSGDNRSYADLDDVPF